MGGPFVGTAQKPEITSNGKTGTQSRYRRYIRRGGTLAMAGMWWYTTR